MSIGMRLYNLRVDSKLSRTELGEKFNVARNTIYRWEQDHFAPKRSTLIKLADFYGVSVDWILKGYESDEDESLEKKLNLTAVSREGSEGRAIFSGMVSPSMEELSMNSGKEQQLTALFGMLSKSRQGRLLGYLDALCSEEMYAREN